jgi:hypothetical protein
VAHGMRNELFKLNKKEKKIISINIDMRRWFGRTGREGFQKTIKGEEGSVLL